MGASKHHGATPECWSFVITEMTTVTWLSLVELMVDLTPVQPREDDSGNLSRELA